MVRFFFIFALVPLVPDRIAILWGVARKSVTEPFLQVALNRVACLELDAVGSNSYRWSSPCNLTLRDRFVTFAVLDPARLRVVA